MHECAHSWITTCQSTQRHELVQVNVHSRKERKAAIESVWSYISSCLKPHTAPFIQWVPDMSPASFCMHMYATTYTQQKGWHVVERLLFGATILHVKYDLKLIYYFDFSILEVVMIRSGQLFPDVEHFEGEMSMIFSKMVILLENNFSLLPAGILMFSALFRSPLSDLMLIMLILIIFLITSVVAQANSQCQVQLSQIT